MLPGLGRPGGGLCPGIVCAEEWQGCWTCCCPYNQRWHLHHLNANEFLIQSWGGNLLPGAMGWWNLKKYNTNLLPGHLRSWCLPNSVAWPPTCPLFTALQPQGLSVPWTLRVQELLSCLRAFTLALESSAPGFLIPTQAQHIPLGRTFLSKAASPILFIFFITCFIYLFNSTACLCTCTLGMQAWGERRFPDCGGPDACTAPHTYQVLNKHL